MTADEKYTQMTQAPVEKLICKLAVPTICSMLITSLYNMADTFFVSKINPSATGAVGVVFSLMAIIQAVGFFFGQGSGSYVSRQLGIHNTQEAEKWLVLVFSLPFFWFSYNDSRTYFYKATGYSIRLNPYYFALQY